MGEIEEKVKDLITARYGTVKHFSEVIDLPCSTVNSIFARGFMNSNIANVFKIAKELHVDVESLARGDIKVDYISVEQNDEQSFRLLSYFSRLNDSGRSEAEKRILEMLSLEQYQNK